MKRCPTCNTQIPEGSAWCRMCGEVFDVRHLVVIGVRR